MNLENKFTEASKKLHDSVLAKARTSQHESNYNKAYKNLVDAGLAFKLKKKYMF